MPLAGILSGREQRSNADFTLLQPGGQIKPTTLLLAHPDLKTQWHLCEPDRNPAKGITNHQHNFLDHIRPLK